MTSLSRNDGKRRVAMILSGGGARGAYEVGVLWYIFDDLSRMRGAPPRIDVLCGTSVGAINACYLAAHLADRRRLIVGDLRDQRKRARLEHIGVMIREARKAGKTVVAERLRPEAEASRVRVKAGHHQVTDGPFAETKEGLGGFYLLECASREEALEWAKKVPIGEGGVVDVRPVWQM